MLYWYVELIYTPLGLYSIVQHQGISVNCISFKDNWRQGNPEWFPSVVNALKNDRFVKSTPQAAISFPLSYWITWTVMQQVMGSQLHFTTSSHCNQHCTNTFLRGSHWKRLCSRKVCHWIWVSFSISKKWRKNIPASLHFFSSIWKTQQWSITGKQTPHPQPIWIHSSLSILVRWYRHLLFLVRERWVYI